MVPLIGARAWGTEVGRPLGVARILERVWAQVAQGVGLQPLLLFLEKEDRGAYLRVW